MFTKIEYLARDKAAAKVALAKHDMPIPVRDFVQAAIDNLKPSASLGDGVAEVIKVGIKCSVGEGETAHASSSSLDAYVGWRLLF